MNDNNSILIQKWKNICTEYYISASNIPESTRNLHFLECFDSFAPKTDEIAIHLNQNSQYDRLIQQFSEAMGADMKDKLRNDDSLWYSLNDARNKSRQECHQHLLITRKNECLLVLKDTEILIENQLGVMKTSLCQMILVHLETLLRQGYDDPSLLTSLIGGIYTWIRLQINENKNSLSWTIDVDLLFERSKEVQQSFGRVLALLGKRNGDPGDSPSWIIRAELSNAFLHRLKRTIERSYRRLQYNLIHIPVEISSQMMQTSTRRSNAQGNADDIFTSLSNQMLPCPII